MLRPVARPTHRPDEQLVRAGVRGARLNQALLDPLDEPPLDEALALPSVGARLLLVAGPLAGFGAILLATWILAGGPAAGFVASMAAGALAGGGKLVILAGALADAPVGSWGLAALLVYLDLATALVTLAGMPLLYRMPGAGPRIAAARTAGWRFVRRHPWTYRATWVSLAGFVAVPFNGTGALVGAFLGRMLGLSRPAIVTATVFGSATGSIALALAGDLWAERVSGLAGHPVLAVAAVLTLAALAILASKWMFGEKANTETPLSTGG